ncbi:hypothetical protein K3G63_13345 [Hymenobacter sp. HSC-4F20]|uniref:DUF6252 family protein n=1 Tax=Hymenobacter sp. HSC-4F20 TaxID=2864135 RepID=UPI001C73BFBC|nr:DUF6252 family protein [Hymenobacter sp. HSC-4F20]MBX0291430.1 hypothetical protein [Hymenobacter sp. HSC-4F20]
MRPLYLLLSSLSVLVACAKKDASPESQLPPVTQTGANTFGCLVNGKVWTPNGGDGNQVGNLVVSYDKTTAGGVLDIRTYRYTDVKKPNTQQYMILFVRQLHGPGTYSFKRNQHSRAYLHDFKTNCYFSSQDSATTYRNGSLTLTRLDEAAGIVSGTFHYTLYTPGCDSLKVTQGRFDCRM